MQRRKSLALESTGQSLLRRQSPPSLRTQTRPDLPGHFWRDMPRTDRVKMRKLSPGKSGGVRIGRISFSPIREDSAGRLTRSRKLAEFLPLGCAAGNGCAEPSCRSCTFRRGNLTDWGLLSQWSQMVEGRSWPQKKGESWPSMESPPNNPTRPAGHSSRDRSCGRGDSNLRSSPDNGCLNCKELACNPSRRAGFVRASYL